MVSGRAIEVNGELSAAKVLRRRVEGSSSGNAAGVAFASHYSRRPVARVVPLRASTDPEGMVHRACYTALLHCASTSLTLHRHPSCTLTLGTAASYVQRHHEHYDAVPAARLTASHRSIAYLPFRRCARRWHNHLICGRGRYPVPPRTPCPAPCRIQCQSGPVAGELVDDEARQRHVICHTISSLPVMFRGHVSSVDCMPPETGGQLCWLGGDRQGMQWTARPTLAECTVCGHEVAGRRG